MLSRLYWHGTLTPKITDKSKKRPDCAVLSFMIKERFYIRYPSFKSTKIVLFRHDTYMPRYTTKITFREYLQLSFFLVSVGGCHLCSNKLNATESIGWMVYLQNIAFTDGVLFSIVLFSSNVA